MSLGKVTKLYYEKPLDVELTKRGVKFVVPAWLSCNGAGASLIGRNGNEYEKQAFNPYLPSWEYIPDGEPYVFNGRVYVYGSHDFYNGYVFCMGDYVCWSAPVDDLGNWRYEGIIYKKTQDPENPDGTMCLYAPDVTVGPDGRYYLFYVLDKLPVVSVAVCDTPAGKYEFLGYVRYPDALVLVKKRQMSTVRSWRNYRRRSDLSVHRFLRNWG